jgi:hypothetical protein
MPTPSNSPDAPYDGTGVALNTPTGAVQEAGYRVAGTEVSSASQQHLAVGQGSSPAPQQHDDESDAGAGQSWFELLRSSVVAMEAAGQLTTAAAVSLRMRRTSPSFTPRAAGFSTFGQFLKAAAASGAIAVDLGKADFYVHAAGQPVPHTRSRSRIRWVLPALWRAFIDWSPQRHYVYHRESRQVLPAPSSPTGAPLEVPIPLLSRDMQLQWMRQFASHLSDEEATRELLEGLDGAEPVSSFSRLIRTHTGLSDKWQQDLREHVLVEIENWAEENRIPTADLTPQPVTSTPQGSSAHTSTVLPSGTADAGAAGPTAHDGEALRAQVLAALERMTLAELLRLPIPAEYLLR